MSKQHCVSAFGTAGPVNLLAHLHNNQSALRLLDPWRRFLWLLKPGGRLLISDYCRAPEPPSAEFGAYIAQRGYDLHSVAAYGAMLEAAGFEGVVAEDRTWQACSFTALLLVP